MLAGSALQLFVRVCQWETKHHYCFFVQVSKTSQPGPGTSCLLASQRPDMSACGYVHITRCGGSRKFNWTPSFDIRRSLLAKMWLQARLASCVLLYNRPFTPLVLTVYNTNTSTRSWKVCGVLFITSPKPGSCFLLTTCIRRKIPWHPLCSGTW